MDLKIESKHGSGFLPRGFRWMASALLFLLGLALAHAASLLAAWLAAKRTAHVGLLLFVALPVFFLCILAVAGLIGKVTQSYSRQRAVLASAALTLLFAFALGSTVLYPMHFPHLVPTPRDNTRYWTLPTGSRIAYSVYEPPPGVAGRPEPIVFVHGGPGFKTFDTDHAFYSQFANDGFRVYLFDQAGAGLSGPLPRASEYSVERFVADLEAIREKIGSDRLILIGQSWGGTLIAHYAVAHPSHVAKLIFHSPGPPWNWADAPSEDWRTDAKKQPLPPVRVLAALLLSRQNIDTAESLVSQQELGDWEAAGLDAGQLVCKGERDTLPQDFESGKISGVNMYPVFAVNHELIRPSTDIRVKLQSLQVPAIALEAQCDYQPWSRVLEYKRSIPGLQEFYFPNAGHFINLAQPKQLAAVLRAFLLDRPSPIPAYRSDLDPRPTLRP